MSPMARPPGGRQLQQTLRELDDALSSTRRLTMRWRAWESLVQTDERGVVTHKPYSDEAIKLWTEALEAAPNDGALLHALAVAWHARAWDLEAVAHPRAWKAWSEALFYWRKVAACAGFWRQLQQKGERVEGTFDAGAMTRARDDLSEDLLWIHVEHIRHFVGTGEHPRAKQHVEIIRRSRLPPAVRAKLAALTHEAMTGGVGRAVAEGDYPAARDLLDRFLDLFPNFTPALQRYLELVRRQAELLSPREQWDELAELGRQAEKRWEALQRARDLSEHPLAQDELAKVACTLGGKHMAMAFALQDMPLETTDFDAAPEVVALNSGIVWSWRAAEFDAVKHDATIDFVNGLLLRSQVNTIRGMNAADASLFEAALSDAEEAMQKVPDEAQPRCCASQVLACRAQHQLQGLTSSVPGDDLLEELERVHVDLTRALELDPESTQVKDSLEALDSIIDMNTADAEED